MKKILAVVALVVLWGAASALAIPLSDVGGNVDSLIAETTLGSNDPATETAWLNTVLGGSHTFEFKDEDLSGEWQTIDGMAGVYAHTLTAEPAYFLIKTGNVTTDGHRDFLFQNLAGLDWAVISLTAMDFTLHGNEQVSTNITGISHISEFDGGQPVPEPATMLLLGSGLLGLASSRRTKTS